MNDGGPLLTIISYTHLIHHRKRHRTRRTKHVPIRLFSFSEIGPFQLGADERRRDHKIHQAVLLVGRHALVVHTTQDGDRLGEIVFGFHQGHRHDVRYEVGVRTPLVVAPQDEVGLGGDETVDLLIDEGLQGGGVGEKR